MQDQFFKCIICNNVCEPSLRIFRCDSSNDHSFSIDRDSFKRFSIITVNLIHIRFTPDYCLGGFELVFRISNNIDPKWIKYSKYDFAEKAFEDAKKLFNNKDNLFFT